MRKNSIKNTRINEEVHHALSNIIRGEIKDPRIHPMTSVVSVEVAPDLKPARHISVFWVMNRRRRIRWQDFGVPKGISEEPLPRQ